MAASSSCPPFFLPKRIGSAHFVDGAWYDNCPLNLAVRLGAEGLLAVEIKGFGLRKRLARRDIPLHTLCSSRPLGMTFFFSPDAAAFSMRLGYLDTLRLYGQEVK